MNIPLNEAAVWVIGAGAVITAAKVIWTLIKKLSKFINLAETYGPVLLNIADQFKKNGGNSLKDQLDRVEHKADTAAETATRAHLVAREGRDLIIRVEERMKVLAPAQSLSIVQTPPIT